MGVWLAGAAIHLHKHRADVHVHTHAYALMTATRPRTNTHTHTHTPMRACGACEGRSFNETVFGLRVLDSTKLRGTRERDCKCVAPGGGVRKQRLGTCRSSCEATPTGITSRPPCFHVCAYACQFPSCARPSHARMSKQENQRAAREPPQFPLLSPSLARSTSKWSARVGEP
jgi:hypothetical protein